MGWAMPYHATCRKGINPNLFQDNKQRSLVIPKRVRDDDFGSDGNISGYPTAT
jgi:hypothetical protein